MKSTTKSTKTSATKSAATKSTATKSTKAPRTAAFDDPPPWYAACLQGIQELGGTMCDPNHCNSTLIKNYSHAYCYCKPPWPGKCVPPSNPPPNCCPNDNSTPVPIVEFNCYCCCGCLANNTPVAIDKDDYKAIEEFQVGDLVYAADDIKLTSWTQRQVQWSAGAGDMGAHNPMIKVTYGTKAKHDYLLVNRVQLFLTSSGTLKPAAALVPGQDSLVAGDGTARPVLSLEVGIYNKGLHHIATSTSVATSPDGHLLLAKNIVVGDWALQLAAATTQSSTKLAMAKGSENMPEFGTKEYEAAVAKHKLDINPFRVALSGFNESIAVERGFEAFAMGNNSYIPENAFAFFTPDQAFDIAQAPTASPGSQVGKQSVIYLFALMGSFYPNIQFYYDEQNLTPNAYFFEEYGAYRVVVTGALARSNVLHFEGLALTIATMIGALTGGPPNNDDGLSCLGIASYSAVTSVMPTVWIGMQSVPIFKAGLAQITELFTYIQKANRGGEDMCMNISTDCRIQCMNAAFQLLPLPYCAGGPADPALEVTGAKGNVGLPHGTIMVSFNMAVDPTTASELGNYGLDPMALTFSAQVSQTDPTTVLVSADLQRATKYQVTVAGVLSSDQQPLVPGEDMASFTTKK